MKEKTWRIFYIGGMVLIFIWSILLFVNIIEITKLKGDTLEYNQLYSKDSIETEEETKEESIDIVEEEVEESCTDMESLAYEIGWCEISVSPYGDEKYCNDIHGWYFDFCNGADFYTWRCSTKKDVEEKRALYENICISERKTCPEGYTCKPATSPISCQES